jgi:hypothetical protein
LPHGQPHSGHDVSVMGCHLLPGLGELDLARPVAIPGRASGAIGRQPVQRLAQPGQAGKLGVQLGDPASDQRLGVATRAAAAVGDPEQLGDLPQPQPEPLGALDEPQPLGDLLGVQAVAGWAALGGG